jgi:hypothetical protein
MRSTCLCCGAPSEAKDYDTVIKQNGRCTICDALGDKAYDKEREENKKKPFKGKKENRDYGSLRKEKRKKGKKKYSQIWYCYGCGGWYDYHRFNNKCSCGTEHRLRAIGKIEKGLSWGEKISKAKELIERVTNEK